MTAERYQQLKSLFQAAQDVEAEKLALFLEENCNGDGELRLGVEKLLASSAKVENFIEKAAYEVLSETLVADEPKISVTGKRIGAYKIVREINHGGMGTVYLAMRDDDLYQKQVAIKIVRGGFESPELRRRFYDERRILARLDHLYIARLLDGGTTDDGLPYYVMDYVDGIFLTSYCEQNNLSINHRLELFRKVCEAVRFAHRNLIIHRDLKPSNILVTADGVPQLLDFGIAKIFRGDEQEEATRTNLHLMTPEYASPEQITGTAVTTASDIYSLGVILYEILTGSRPFHFKSGSLEEIIFEVTKREPVKPSDASLQEEEKRRKGYEEKGRRGDAALLSFCPFPFRPFSSSQLMGDLDNIVLKSLRKEPERRYSSVEQFAEDIRRHQAGLPVSARPATLRYRSSKFVRRNKIGVAAAAVIMILLIGGAIAILRQTAIAAREAKVAAEQRDKARREQARAERINKFFQEMLAVANPSWYAPGFNKPRDMTVIESLDEAARKIENSLEEEPEVKAEILITIGDTYASMGRFKPSERALESALKLRREIDGEDSVKTADALFLLANTKRALDKPDETLRLYEEAYPIYLRHPAQESQFAYFLLDYANSFSRRHSHAEAVRLTREAIEMLRILKGETSPAVAVARENLATAYYIWGDMDNALREVTTASEMIEPLTSTLYRLGQIRFSRDEFGQAEPILLEVAARLEKEDRPILLPNVLLLLANLNQTRNNHQKAEDLTARAIAIARRLYAPDRYSLLNHLVMQGLILARAGKIRQGETIMRDALLRMTDEQRKGFDASLGEILLLQKRFAEAEPLLLNNYLKLKETQHPASPRLKKAAEQLEKLYAEIPGARLSCCRTRIDSSALDRRRAGPARGEGGEPG